MFQNKKSIGIKKLSIIGYLQDYRFNSLLVRSFVLIISILLVSFLGIMILVRNEMNNIITKEVGNMSIEALNKTQERMDTTISEAEQIAGKLSLDSDVMQFLLPEASHVLGQNVMMTVKEKIEMYAGISEYIESIYIYSSKNGVIVTSEYGGSLEEFEDLTWYDNLMTRGYEPVRVICRLKENKYPYVLSYIQPMRLTQMQFLGGIIINLDIDKLNELFISNREKYSENLIIMDKRENVIFSSQASDLLKKMKDLDFYTMIDLEHDGYQIIDSSEGSQIVSISSSGIFDWKYISIVSLETYLTEAHNTKGFYIILISFIIIISLMASVVISIYNYIPVRKILNLLKNPNLGDNITDIDIGLKKDEANEIGLNIIRNLYSNQQMKKDMDNYAKIINKAQVTALQAQISPHFLYNTLENIRWRVIAACEGDNEVAQTIMNLSQMLRTSLDNEKQIITIEEEIQNAKLYIDILQLRYENKLKVIWDVEDSTLQLPIVKVCLQPLIENAVYHGIKPKRGNGTIRITIQRLAQSVRIRIQDDGIGMKEEEIHKINEMMSEKYILSENHIGISNVNQRVKLLISNEVSLRIQSKENIGTTIDLEIPLTISEAI
jgi:two-component system, sensor histidine kinase YesM